MTRILVVDDHEHGRQLTVYQLAPEGYEVVAAASIAEALAQAGPWDALILDEHLPDGSGRWIAEAWHGVPALFLSGLPVEGQTALLKSRFTGDDLRAAVREMLTNQGERP